MQVTIKLFATFRKDRFDIETRELPAGTTVGQVVEALELPHAQLGILMVNSRHVELGHTLAEGDILAIFPLVGGG